MLPTRVNVALALATTVSLSGAFPAAGAQAEAEPVFQLPVPCGETWTATTRAAHEPSIDAVDLDRPGDAGATVLAGADGGRVSVVGPVAADAAGTGGYVTIAYPGGIDVHLAHLDTVDVVVDQLVDAQTPIGTVGASAEIPGTSLHYEQRLGGVPRPAVIDGRTWVLGVDVTDDAGDATVVGVAHTSANCAADPPAGSPQARPERLPAGVPWVAGEAHSLIESDLPGLGLTFAGESGDLVLPVYGGDVIYTGCATGWAAPLGHIVVVRSRIDQATYDTIYGHLDPGSPLVATAVGPGDPLGRFGSSATVGGSCDGAGDGPARLFVGILRDAEVRPGGTIAGGRPIAVEPLVGLGAYRGFTWWSGPATAVRIDDGAGRPRGRWSNRATTDGASVRFGEPVRLSARVRDTVPIREVHFTAYYDGWARPNSAARLDGFDEKTTWRIVAVCRPPGERGEPPTTKGCRWDGSATDAVVSFAWDPSEPVLSKAAPWQPLSRVAIADGSTRCVPVSIAFDVYDAAGYRAEAAAGKKQVRRCRSATNRPGRVVNLEPPRPPAAPGNVRLVCDYRGSGLGNGGRQVGSDCLVVPDSAHTLQWTDRSDNEDGFYILARRRGGSFTGPGGCGGSGRFVEQQTGWVRIATLPAGTTSYRVSWEDLQRLIPTSYTALEADVRVQAYNGAGSSALAGNTSLTQIGDYC